MVLLRMNDKGSTEDGCGERIINTVLIMLSLCWTSIVISGGNLNLDTKYISSKQKTDNQYEASAK